MDTLVFSTIGIYARSNGCSISRFQMYTNYLAMDSGFHASTVFMWSKPCSYAL
ncbi:MAG TPA: hypothetical protein VNA15_10675 [Candidatus Angelobacter sp.]|nr:hypothetical protein [Candidatus Angelobacter sp.]